MSNIALKKKLIEGIVNPAAATDGVITGYTHLQGFAMFHWPGTLTVDLEKSHRIFCIRILIWDGKGQPGAAGDQRVYLYRLLTSGNNKDWIVLHDSSNRGTKGWQVFNIPAGLDARYVRIHGMWNSANSEFHVVEVEVHDATPEPLVAETIVQKTCETSEANREIGDGYPLERDMKAVISKIEEAVAGNEVLNQELFGNLIRELRTQVADVAAIERSMDSIRREITEPVKNELIRSNRMGVWFGWWTIAGCIIGVISGFLAAIPIFQSVGVDRQSKKQSQTVAPSTVPTARSTNLYIRSEQLAKGQSNSVKVFSPPMLATPKSH